MIREAIAGISMVLGLSVAGAAQAQTYGGINFAPGTIAFADRVVSYEPRLRNGRQPLTAYGDPSKALGAPDYQQDFCASQASCSFVSLGDGGRITLEFTKSFLTGSGSAAADLFIFEIGGYVEGSRVEISRNGTDWLSLGNVLGSTQGVDIDSFGYGRDQRFSFVRLTDLYNTDPLGRAAGSDIDAVGILAAVPEPATWAMMTLGFAITGLAVRRRKRTRTTVA